MAEAYLKRNSLTLEYQFMDKPEKLEKAFDVLFEEVAKELEKQKIVELSTPALASMHN